jgi:2-C-methyl-D-erythritol 4-phosphate cytidylyltransferase / 2-C-methyl-D-erythritol 2,4-cyclodiphosphate synthase
LTKFFAVVPAAGSGSRFGGEVPKQYARLGGVPVINRTVRTLLAEPRIERVYVTVATDDTRAADLLAHEVASGRVKVIASGGETRARTVRNALTAVTGGGAKNDDWVLVHDAARPGLDAATLARLIDTLKDHNVGGLLAMPVADTIKREEKRAKEENHPPAPKQVESTVYRTGLWQAQTPQMFRVGLLVQALNEALQDEAEPTDEAQAVERSGHAPLLVTGTRNNFKITVQEDLEAMEKLMGTVTPAIRIGEGFDVHALMPGRKLIIGGVEIAHPTGLLGHSDADVLLHTITDALLGAAGLGDIGKHFPDTAKEFEGADSLKLLTEAYKRVQDAGWMLVNVDATIIAQAPKMAPYIPKMIDRIAKALDVEAEQINIKAKTTEKLGFTGRQEGIAAQAVAMVSKRS